MRTQCIHMGTQQNKENILVANNNNTCDENKEHHKHRIKEIQKNAVKDGIELSLKQNNERSNIKQKTAKDDMCSNYIFGNCCNPNLFCGEQKPVLIYGDSTRREILPHFFEKDRLICYTNEKILLYSYKNDNVKHVILKIKATTGNKKCCLLHIFVGNSTQRNCLAVEEKRRNARKNTEKVEKEEKKVVTEKKGDTLIHIHESVYKTWLRNFGRERKNAISYLSMNLKEKIKLCLKNERGKKTPNSKERRENKMRRKVGKMSGTLFPMCVNLWYLRNRNFNRSIKIYMSSHLQCMFLNIIKALAHCCGKRYSERFYICYSLLQKEVQSKLVLSNKNWRSPRILYHNFSESRGNKRNCVEMDKEQHIVKARKLEEDVASFVPFSCRGIVCVEGSEEKGESNGSVNKNQSDSQETANSNRQREGEQTSPGNVGGSQSCGGNDGDDGNGDDKKGGDNNKIGDEDSDNKNKKEEKNKKKGNGERNEKSNYAIMQDSLINEEKKEEFLKEEGSFFTIEEREAQRMENAGNNYSMNPINNILQTDAAFTEEMFLDDSADERDMYEELGGSVEAKIIEENGEFDGISSEKRLVESFNMEKEDLFERDKEESVLKLEKNFGTRKRRCSVNLIIENVDENNVNEKRMEGNGECIKEDPFMCMERDSTHCGTESIKETKQIISNLNIPRKEEPVISNSNTNVTHSSNIINYPLNIPLLPEMSHPNVYSSSCHSSPRGATFQPAASVCSPKLTVTKSPKSVVDDPDFEEACEIRLIGTPENLKYNQSPPASSLHASCLHLTDVNELVLSPNQPVLSNSPIKSPVTSLSQGSPLLDINSNGEALERMSSNYINSSPFRTETMVDTDADADPLNRFFEMLEEVENKSDYTESSVDTKRKYTYHVDAYGNRYKRKKEKRDEVVYTIKKDNVRRIYRGWCFKGKHEIFYDNHQFGSVNEWVHFLEEQLANEDDYDDVDMDEEREDFSDRGGGMMMRMRGIARERELQRDRELQRERERELEKERERARIRERQEKRRQKERMKHMERFKAIKNKTGYNFHEELMLDRDKELMKTNKQQSNNNNNTNNKPIKKAEDERIRSLERIIDTLQRHEEQMNAEKRGDRNRPLGLFQDFDEEKDESTFFNFDNLNIGDNVVDTEMNTNHFDNFRFDGDPVNDTSDITNDPCHFLMSAGNAFRDLDNAPNVLQHTNPDSVKENNKTNNGWTFNEGQDIKLSDGKSGNTFSDIDDHFENKIGGNESTNNNNKSNNNNSNKNNSNKNNNNNENDYTKNSFNRISKTNKSQTSIVDQFIYTGSFDIVDKIKKQNLCSEYNNAEDFVTYRHQKKYTEKDEEKGNRKAEYMYTNKNKISETAENKETTETSEITASAKINEPSFHASNDGTEKKEKPTYYSEAQKNENFANIENDKVLRNSPLGVLNEEVQNGSSSEEGRKGKKEKYNTNGETLKVKNGQRKKIHHDDISSSTVEKKETDFGGP